MCGEHLRDPGDKVRREGIIPACAGSTRLVQRHAVITRDHPRMCGEHQAHTVLAQVKHGIIPACAGSTA